MRTACVAAALVVAGAGAGARAQMYGHDLRAEWRNPAFDSTIETHLVTVGPGVELLATDIVNDDKFQINIWESTVDFDFLEDAIWVDNKEFNGWHFEDVNDALPDIIGYHIFSHHETVIPVVESGWSDNAFWADFSGTEIHGAGRLTMQVLFVPAPGAAAALAVGGLAALRRRRR